MNGWSCRRCGKGDEGELGGAGEMSGWSCRRCGKGGEGGLEGAGEGEWLVK